MPNNSIFKKRLSKKVKRELILAGLAFIVITGLIIWDVSSNGPLTALFSDRERLERAVNDMGIYGPSVYIFFQILQTIIAPIPGNIVSVIGGYIFGWWGILWTLIGSGIGFFIVFWISRRFGRPLVEKVVKKSALDKFDFIFSKRGSMVLFLIFLFPGFPDDIVCYIAGLTEIPIKKLMLLVIIGRFPSIVANNYIGSGLGDGNYMLVGAIVAIAAVLLMIAYWQQERLTKFMNKISHNNPSVKKLGQRAEKIKNDIETPDDTIDNQS